MTTSQPLPITPHRERIVAELERAGALILTAPTGSGKSTQTPQFLRGRVPGRILVLEPRRLSARSLAARVAAETKTALGAEIGYQVRFDSRCGAKTQVVFQTYGIFTARIMAEPDLAGVGAVLLDEFHERTLECDLALAWLKSLRKRRPDLKVVVMSATLDNDALRRYLPDAASVEVPGRLHPVEVRHSPLASREGVAEGTLRTLRELFSRDGLNGNILVFMPGLREIRRTAAVLAPFCREHGIDLRQLHGSMDLTEQQNVLEPSDAPRLIVTTNVAETGLTVPGVTLVVDAGLHRVAAFDAARGINTLYVARISRANADQRAGRAGRTAPGKCVRLWSKADEAGMAPSLKPEVARLELSPLFLQAASLPGVVEWLTPPNPIAWAAAKATLENLGAIDAESRITAKGRALNRYPAPPRVAAVLDAARGLGPEAYERACAMAAVFESEGDRPPGSPADLSALADDLRFGSRGEFPWETTEIFKQFLRLGEKDASGAGPADALARVWLDCFADRLAAREGEGAYYKLPDGRGAVLPVEKNPPELILALDVRERAGGGQARQIFVSLYLPYSSEQIQRMFPAECAWSVASGFDERKQRVIREERLMFRGLVLARRDLKGGKEEKKDTAEIWAEKYATGELRHPGVDEKILQLTTRIRIARELYPDLGYPEMSEDDWRLIYGEAFHGKNNAKDIERVNLLPHVESYLGAPLKSHLDRVLPATKKLPSGKTGRFSYFYPPRAELSARLGDFVKMTGTLSLCEGRLPVAFDVLAPNYRTVQKTNDLSSFWKNTYPTVKKELQRKYPKHPWP